MKNILLPGICTDNDSIYYTQKTKEITTYAKVNHINIIESWPDYLHVEFEIGAICKEKKSEGMLCRQHTSIERVLKGNRVLYDLDTNVYFYKNEIFRMVGNKLVIVYCPHPKLISGEITDSKVRKINPITVEDENLTCLPAYDKVSEFISSSLMEQNLKCWFNYEFSLVTLPNDRNKADWCLVPNK